MTTTIKTGFIPPLTLEQAIVVTGYTGITCCTFKAFHEDVEKRLERTVFIHEFSSRQFQKHLKKIYKKDFIAMSHEASSGDISL